MTIYNYNHYSNKLIPNCKLNITIIHFSSQLIDITETIALTFHNNCTIQYKLRDKGIKILQEN